MPQGSQQMTDSAPDESPFEQVIPSIPQQTLYPSLAALETSANTAVSQPIPFSRRVINDIEEQQRKALKDTVEGNIRLTNTLPISDTEEQDEEVIISSLNPQAAIMQADTQEETLQLESSEIEDTSIKKVDTQEDQNTVPTKNQNTGPTEAQNTGDINERAVPDSIDSQIEEDGTTPENDSDDYIFMTKILQCKMIRCLKHPKMTIIILPLTMMMILMTQYSLATQSPNHSCQEVSEYPLQR